MSSYRTYGSLLSDDYRPNYTLDSTIIPTEINQSIDTIPTDNTITAELNTIYTKPTNFGKNICKFLKNFALLIFSVGSLILLTTFFVFCITAIINNNDVLDKLNLLSDEPYQTCNYYVINQTVSESPLGYQVECKAIIYYYENSSSMLSETCNIKKNCYKYSSNTIGNNQHNVQNNPLNTQYTQNHQEFSNCYNEFCRNDTIYNCIKYNNTIYGNIVIENDIGFGANDVADVECFISVSHLDHLKTKVTDEIKFSILYMVIFCLALIAIFLFALFMIYRTYYNKKLIELKFYL